MTEAVSSLQKNHLSFKLSARKQKVQNTVFVFRLKVGHTHTSFVVRYSTAKVFEPAEMSTTILFPVPFNTKYRMTTKFTQLKYLLI